MSHKKTMNIQLDTSESDQLGSFQNATLHSITPSIACSIAVEPRYPPDIKTQEQAAEYLKKELVHLAEAGWDIRVQIGKSCDSEFEE